jgi:hypothetical protein
MFRTAENTKSFIVRMSPLSLLALCLALSACTGAVSDDSSSASPGAAAESGSPAATTEPSPSGQPLASQGTQPTASPTLSITPSPAPSPSLASLAPTAKPTVKPTEQPTPGGDPCGPGASAPVASEQAPVPKINSGYFAAAAAIPKGGGSDAAILLPNGKVLVLGAGRALLYTPATNTISPAGAMVVERQWPLAAALPGGKVLVIGGYSFQGCVSRNIDDVEVYDSAANRFSRIDSPFVGDVYEVATTLADGKILLTQGWTVDEAHPDGIRSSALFDPVTSKFTLLDGSLQPLPGAAASRLPDGSVLFAGGMVASGNGYAATDAAVLYRPNLGTFVSVAGKMTVPRSNASATLLPDGTVLIAGGRSSDEAADAENYYLNSAELYDYRTGQFTATGSMLARRSGHSATLLADGSVLIAGAAGASAEIWSNGSFHATAGPMTHPRLTPSGVALPDGRVLVVGEGTADLYQP